MCMYNVYAYVYMDDCFTGAADMTQIWLDATLVRKQFSSELS